MYRNQKISGVLLFLAFFATSCSEDCENKVDILFNNETIGSACIHNDSIVDMNIDSKFADKICSDLLLVPGLQKEYLEAQKCPEYSSTREYSIIKSKGIDEHFEENGLFNQIDSLKQTKNYDSLKRLDTKRLDSLMKEEAFN